MNIEYKAVIKNWRKVGKYIWGDFKGHPNFGDKFTHTSRVINCQKLEDGTYSILTRSGNYYHLIEPSTTQQ